MAVKIIFCHLECLTVSYSIEFSVNELSLNVYRIKSIFEYSYVTNSAIVCTMYLFKSLASFSLPCQTRNDTI